MSQKDKKLFLVASFEDVSILRKYAILFLVSSIIPMVLLYYVYFKNQKIGMIAMFLMALGVLVGYFSIRSLLIKAIKIAKENQQALLPFLNPETVKELNEGQNELVVLSRTFSAVTKQLESNINELKKKNDELKAFDQLKDDFVYTVSHEFRLPLTIIQESIRQISEGMFGEINEKQMKYFNMSLRNIDRLKTLIDNMLDISKIEQGKLVIHETKFDIKDIITEVISDFSQKVEGKGLIIRHKLPAQTLEVIADRDKITQVFVNLIGNACKFTEKGSIEVSTWTNGNHIECGVEDTGPGIAPKDLPLMFSKFHQIGRWEGKVDKGTGLGLVISKNIIELHGGRIYVESTLGQGSRFIFSLPKAAEDSYRKEENCEKNINSR